jgi:hypothetical protein
MSMPLDVGMTVSRSETNVRMGELSQVSSKSPDGKSMNPDGRVIFRPEIPMRILWAVGTLVFALAAVGFVSDPMPSDSGWWVFLGISVAIVALGARGVLVRAVADEHGVRLVNIFSSHRSTWDSIDRFELSPGTRSPAMLVTKTGKRRRLAHLQVSPGEQRRGRSNHTQDVVEALQQLLLQARSGNG